MCRWGEKRRVKREKSEKYLRKRGQKGEQKWEDGWRRRRRERGFKFEGVVEIRRQSRRKKGKNIKITKNMYKKKWYI